MPNDERTVKVQLKDYLQPGGKHPYRKIYTDLSKLVTQGKRVHVISVPGFLMLIGGTGSYWITALGLPMSRY